MADLMSSKKKKEGAGTTKNSSPVIELPQHRKGEYNPFNRHGGSGQKGPARPK